jgi:hypothetical protein
MMSLRNGSVHSRLELAGIPYPLGPHWFRRFTTTGRDEVVLGCSPSKHRLTSLPVGSLGVDVQFAGCGKGGQHHQDMSSCSPSR